MSVSSMTGFARVDGAHAGKQWTWELKSVNGRGLEMRFRLPPGLDEIEPALRRKIAAQLKRGSVFANLQFASSSAQTRMRLNEPALADAIAAINNIRGQIDCAAPRAEVILGLRGVLEPAEEELDEGARADFNEAIVTSFSGAVEGLGKARQQEGAAMASVVAGHVDDIEQLTAKAAADPAVAPSAIRDRVSAQLAELLADAAIGEDRLAQEAALMAVKADIREELNRLAAHVEAARSLLKRGGPVGRELDFLTQEFNRETNTLCSKAQNMQLKQTGLDLKKTIEQLREQIQNIE